MNRIHRLTYRRRIAWVWACACLLWAGLGGAEPPAEQDWLQAPPAATVKRPPGGDVVDIIPERFLRSWDAVTIFFTRAIGPAKPGPENEPSRVVQMQPQHPGAYTWLNARTLQFRPAEPWPPLTRFQWTLAGNKRKVLTTLMQPPSETIPAHQARGLDPVQAITLRFPQPLDPAVLAKMLTIELRDLPGVGDDKARWLDHDDFRIKVMERQQHTDPASYVLTLNEPIGAGVRAVVHLRLSLEDRVEQAFSRIVFDTIEPFRVTHFGCSSNRYPVTPDGVRYTREQAIQCDSDQRAVQVVFSDAPAALGPVQARNLVRFTPAVKDLGFQVSGQTLFITGRFEADRLYRLAVVPSPVQDTKARGLQIRGPSEVFLYFPPKQAFLDWQGGQGIVERFGPQMFPLAGRGYDRVDLRIYPIDPLSRSFWPFPEQPVMVDESLRPPGPGERPAPFTDPSRAVSATELAGQIQALGSPAVSQLVALPLRGAGAAKFGLDLKPHLARVSGADRPGSYLVGIRKLDGSSTRAWVRLQVTDLSLTAVEEFRAVRFVVTSLASGQPVAGASVALQGAVNDQRWQEFAAGRTDQTGTFLWRGPGTTHGALRRIVVRKGDDVLVFDPARGPERFADNTWHKDHSTWLQWTLGSVQNREPEPDTLCHIFTERPVYQPQHAVHIKGYVRSRADGAFAAGGGGYGRLVVEGPGDRRWRYSLQLTAAGSFYHKFAEQDLPSGEYKAYFEPRKGACSETVRFKKEAYRLPRFEVRLHAPDQVPLDRPFDVRMSASYYAGGQVVGRPVRWRVVQYPYTWTPQKRAGFVYSSDGRFSRREPFRTKSVLQREAATDENGAATISLDPASEPTAQPRSYVIESTVVGADDQTVTNTRRVIALPPLVLGLKAPRYLESAQDINAELIVVQPDGALLAGQEVTIRLLQRQWHSHLEATDFTQGGAKYVTNVVDEKVSETKRISSAEPLKLNLPIQRAGVYIIEAETRDRLGRAQVVSVDLYAGGDQPVTWSRPPAKVFQVTPDKTKYEPGDTAHLVLQSPFQKARALAIVEAPEGNRYAWLAVEQGSATFKLKIEKHFVPRLPVHFVLMRGRVDPQGAAPTGKLDLAKPATVAATRWVDVKPVEHRVHIDLENPARAQPGDEITVKLRLRDKHQQPLAGEVTLWLVDHAVLALGKEQALDPLDDFIKPRPSYLELRDTRNLALGYLALEEDPGGDAPAKAGDNLLDKVTVRQNFQPVPYFNPVIQVGPSGDAEVKVKLPDNLTNFKLRAKAVSGFDRFGFAKGDLAVRLAVIVQPALPRFVRPGDEFVASAIGRVVEGEGGAGRAQAQAQGLDFDGPTEQVLQWQVNQPQRLDFAVRVPTPAYTGDGKLPYQEVSFSCAVERSTDQARDAFKLKLPLLADRAPVRKRLIGELAPGATLALPAVDGPARTGTVRRALLVSDQPALVRMAAGLNVLLEYPHGCTEQRISRARGFLAMDKFNAVLQREGAEAERKRVVEETLASIATTVDPNGLQAYWPGSAGYVSLTAWVVQFMTEARAAGFTVNEALYKRLLATLKQALRSDYRHFIDSEAYTERTMALWALAAAGEMDAAYAAELARKANYLNLESQAQLSRVLRNAGAGVEPSLAKLDQRMWDGMVFRLHQGREIYGGLQESAAGRNALVLPSDVRTLAELLRSLQRSPQAQLRIPLLVDALVAMGTDDGWGSTNANVSALLALSEYMEAPAAAAEASAPAIELQLDGESRPLAWSGAQRFIRFASNLAGAGEIKRGQDGSQRPVIVRAETSYIPAAHGSQVAPAAQGFVVSRELLHIPGADQPPQRLGLGAGGQSLPFKVGDVVEDHVEVANPQARTFVAVVVPLAAGLEPLNPRLATAPPEAQPQGQLSLAPTYASYEDDQVVFYYNELPKGTYHFYFRTRATVPGSFTQPAAYAEMMYDQATRGHSAGARIVVAPAPAAAKQ